MANSYLDSVQQARQFVQDHVGDWTKVDEEILKVVAHAQNIKVPVDSGSLKELNNRIEEQIDLRKQLAQTVAQQEAVIKSLQSQLTKLSATQKASSKALTDEERQLKAVANSEKRLIDVKSKHWRTVESNRTQANQVAQATRNTLTTYGAYSQKLIALTRDYKNLAIRKAELNNLTEEEAAKMAKLEAQISKLRGNLVAVDHSVGQFGRSVGSYGKQFDSLGFSIAQITREMPAFAYGAQIGFAALSNNIPMLFDEITKLKTEMADLAAQGKKTGSVVGRLASAVFSFQSLISIGVTLLTLYGADLIELAFGATESEKAQKALNEAIAEGEADSRAASGEMRAYVGILKDATASEAAREGALKALKEEVAELSGVELTQKDAMQQVIDKTAPYIVAAEARAKADAFARLAAEAEAKLIELKAKSIEDSTKWYDYIAAAVTNYGQATGIAFETTMRGLENHTEAVKEQEGIVNLMNDAYSDYLQQALEAESKITDKTKKGTEAKREDVEALEEMNRQRRFSVAYYEQVISALEQEQKIVARSSEEWARYQKAIEEAQKAILIITDIQKYAQEELAMTAKELEKFAGDVQINLDTKGVEKGMEALSQITGQSLEEMYGEMARWYGTDYEAFKRYSEAKIATKEDEAEKMKEVQKEIAQAAIAFVNGLFTAEIEKIDQRIEKNKDFYAQILAGEELTEERRAALEAERDLRERKLMKERRKRENQQFLFEQGIALAKVIMHTATAITEALPNVALAALMGILGGIQAATIIALSVPKFAKGTENAPAGLAIVDEIQPEVHTDRRGRVKSYGSSGGANYRFLEQGDKIYRSRKEYFDKVGPKGIENAIFDLNIRRQGEPVTEKDLSSAMLRELLSLKGENSKVWKEVKKLASRPIFNTVKVEMPDNRMY